MTSVHIFDAYGTLFDVHSAVRAHAQKIGPNADAMSALWRTKQLEYSWVHGLMKAPSDFWSITREALDFAMTVFDIRDPALKQALLDSYWRLQPYPEVKAYLSHLQSMGVQTGILSNGSPDMLSAAVQSAGLSSVLTAILSVHSANTFKTHKKTYALVTEHFSVAPKDVTFYSSNRWDIAGATHFGFETVWVNRTDQPDEYKTLPPNRIIQHLE